VFGSGWLGNQALCIAKAESGLRANATHLNSNGTWDVGLMQLNDVHGYSWNQRLDPDFNLEAAYKIRMSWGNWSAWSSRHKCGL